ncbi:Mut7-C RNAse domain-containing protein [Maribellus mangrovi]|uniref:Mut7-C RNAse domain-containing protein n=1 Tax=Maribellus mangrovi TaxID=3133146 RepID=UPI0030EFA079
MRDFHENTTNHAPKIRQVKFRFYEELNDHLPDKQKKKSFAYTFKGKPSVKNAIQAIGVPHGEVDLILVNGNSVDFDYQLKGGEEISVYPVFESLDIAELIRLRAEPLRQTKFVVDVNLGKLALKLRLLGFDTVFRNDLEDDEIVEISRKESRIILTRDRGILQQNAVTHGYFLRNTNPKKQLVELVKQLQLQNSFQPFTRCSVCNGSLEPVEKCKLHKELKAGILEFHDAFWQCKGCKKIYWEGSHFKRINQWIEELKDS